MRIAIDMDDTVSNFVKEWVRRYNKKFNDSLNYLDVTAWDIDKFVKCSSKEMYDILDEDKFFLSPEVEPFSKIVIDKLRKNNDVFIVTATYNPKVCSDKAKWLKDNLGFEQKDIIYAIRKELIKADMLIDDGSHNIRKFDGIRVVYDRPHNQDLREYEYDIRVRGWKDVDTYCRLKGYLEK